MTLKELKKYRRRVRQLSAIGSELERYKVSDSVEGSRGAPSFEKTSQIIEGYPHTERVMQLLAQQSWLKAYIQEAEDFIFSVEDERVCEALILYCMDERLYDELLARAKKNGDSLVSVTWEDVAEKMGETSGDTVRMAVYRYLDRHNAQ